jgi:hypothetical protein
MSVEWPSVSNPQSVECQQLPIKNGGSNAMKGDAMMRKKIPNRSDAGWSRRCVAGSRCVGWLERSMSVFLPFASGSSEPKESDLVE